MSECVCEGVKITEIVNKYVGRKKDKFRRSNIGLFNYLWKLLNNEKTLKVIEKKTTTKLRNILSIKMKLLISLQANNLQ